MIDWQSFILGILTIVTTINVFIDYYILTKK
jgi:hypothetical protein